MGGHPAGITVDAVREQLAALGHDDVSDDVIASFLDSLHRQANVAPPPVETTDAPTPRGRSPEATAARTPGGTERAPRPTSPEPDATRAGSTSRSPTPNDAGISNRRAAPTGARPRPTSSGCRAATTRAPLAIPTVITPAVSGDASRSNTSRTPPDRRTPSSAMRHRPDRPTPKDAHEDAIGWCAKRNVASVTPGRVTGGKTTPSVRRTGTGNGRNGSSVIASPMPIRAGVGTPGQRVRIDRVARAAQYAAVWSGDAYLERRRAGDGGGGKSPAGNGRNGRSTSGAESRVLDEDADEATVFGTRSKLARDRYDGYDRYDVNGARGGSWGRAQRKLTDGTNEWRVDVDARAGGSGFWDDNTKRGPIKAATGKGFKTPDERRRDALRWEVRARMAAPPTF